MRYLKANAPARRVRGVGLIEVLIAVLVLSIGFLAAATMQVQGMRTNQNAGERAQALVLLNDMMDRMRNNPAGVSAGLYSNKTTGTMVEPACVTNGCDDAELADLDLFEWSANFQALRGESNFIPLLPVDSLGAAATGSISAPVDGIYTLAINWKRYDGFVEVTENISLSFLP